MHVPILLWSRGLSMSSVRSPGACGGGKMDLEGTTMFPVFLELWSCSVFFSIPGTRKPQDCLGYGLAVFTSLGKPVGHPRL